MKSMSDYDFAEELVRRLNMLLNSHEDVPPVLDALFDATVPVLVQSVAELHPTLKPTPNIEGVYQLGFMELLNGLMNPVQRGEHKGRGMVRALFCRSAVLASFGVTPEPEEELLNPKVPKAVDDASYQDKAKWVARVASQAGQFSYAAGRHPSGSLVRRADNQGPFIEFHADGRIDAAGRTNISCFDAVSILMSAERTTT